jgi:hypothetical protein
MPIFCQRRGGITAQEMGDELLLLDTLSDRVHQLNRTASFIYKLCAKPITEEGIADALVQEFDVAKDVALVDAARALQTLKEQSLIEAAPPIGPA